MELRQGNCQALTRLARTHGWLDKRDNVTELRIAGAGNMNRVLRARLDSGGTLIFKQSLPYVAKYPSIPAPLERLDVEANFYAVIAGASALAVRMPAIVGYDAVAHILCMQDLGEACDLTYLYERPERDRQREQPEDGRDRSMSTLIYWLWKLHSLAVPDERAGEFANSAMRALNHEHIFVVPLREDNGVALGATLQEAARVLRGDGAFIDAARLLGEIYLGRAPHASRRCLLHGDFYPGSWLAHDTMGVMVIDPEFAFYGAPEFDVGVMLAHLTFAGFDQARVMRLLQAYVTPDGFSYALAMQFAGMEIIRRLLGVAQLPLHASDAAQQQWLTLARGLVVAS